MNKPSTSSKDHPAVNTNSATADIPHLLPATNQLWSRPAADLAYNRGKAAGSAASMRVGTYVSTANLRSMLAMQCGFDYDDPKNAHVKQQFESLFRGKDRIYSIQAGNIANLSASHQSARKLLAEINDLTKMCLDRVKDRFDEAQAVYATVNSYDSSCVDGLGDGPDGYHYIRQQDPSLPFSIAEAYWSIHGAYENLKGGYETLDELLCEVRHFNPSFLHWLVNLRNESAQKQKKWMDYLLPEHKYASAIEWYLNSRSESFDLEAENEEIYRNNKALLEEHRNSHSAFEWQQSGYQDESAPSGQTEPEKCWKTRWKFMAGVATLSWVPIPQILSNAKSDTDIFKLKRGYAALGEWMSNVGLGLQLWSYSGSGIDAEELESRVAALNEELERIWVQIRNEGVVLKGISTLLKVLSDPVTESRRCLLCHRRVGVDKHKYCAVHGEYAPQKGQTPATPETKNEATHDVTPRTRLRQSIKVAQRYIPRANALTQALSTDEFFQNPVAVLGNALSQVPKRQSYAAPDLAKEAHERHNVLMQLLRPVAGDLLYPALKEVSDLLCENLYAALDSLLRSQAVLSKSEAELADDLEREIANERKNYPAPSNPRGLLSSIETDRAIAIKAKKKVDERFKKKNSPGNLKTQLAVSLRACQSAEAAFQAARNALSVEKFFSAFFVRTNTYLRKTDDPFHPLVDRRFTAIHDASANPFNLDEIIRDDLRTLRAWKEEGGDQIDQSFAAKKGLDVEHARKRFNIDDVKECLDALRAQRHKPTYQPTYQELAHELFNRKGIRVTHSAVYLKIQRHSDEELKAQFASRSKG
jgi:hypothetical protein